MSPRLALAALTGAAICLAAAVPAAGHGGVPARAATDRAAAAVRLHHCFMTVALVPRPRDALRAAIPSPPDLTQTFYGPDPLVSLWGLACDRAWWGPRGRAASRSRSSRCRRA
jgi:hypothetical protein